MRLLVTGGAGFIGSNFIQYMLRHYPGYEIINADVLTYAGNVDNLLDVEHHPNYRFIHADITRSDDMEPLFQEKIDVVVNFAAESHVDRSIADPGIFVRTNVMGTQVLLDSSLKYGVSKYVQISTDEVYGSLGESGFFTEETPLAPNSPYSASKAGADMLVRAYHETFGLPVNITRCSNNYGPFQFPEKLIPLMISNALEEKPLPVYGDGLHVRDWLYVEDHCSAIDRVIHQGRNGEVYNIGGNNEFTNLQIVTTLLQQLGKPDSLVTFVADRLGHDRRYAIDSSKIQNELGWKPRYSFVEGIQHTIQWYVNNQAWLQRIRTGPTEHNYTRCRGKGP
ncbi:dTDP-glucose 4,6-dehydratase [Paenibacillus dendritiformis C454]|uniref:dTDP-glucose 4,6-dehydratase n=1 Tax=Paenibacillus dendritiformis C454 TaxID=1131935 RepID=H3S9L3_9BACL|nr:dTDP-glucose 4,6-dehydratase [Paenibacillus dendritiformis]EHQ64131.1 dTDP-glucose 4,6-dehydratase [Paenibacillus dendritiformis C454]